MTELIFCEKAADVSWSANFLSTSSAPCIIIALTPEAAWACQSRTLSYLKLEDFIDSKDLYSHRLEVFKLSHEWIQWLDRYLELHLSSMAGKGFCAATAHSFIFQLLFDEFFAAAYALKALFQVYPKATVRYRMPEIPSHQDILSHRAPLILYVLPDIAASCQAQLAPVTEITAELPISRPARGFKSWLFGFLAKVNLAGELNQIRYAGMGRYIRSRMRRRQDSPDPLLILGCGYDIDFLVMALREQRAPLRWIQSLSGARVKSSRIDGRLQREFENQWVSLRSQESFWAPLRRWGIGGNEFFASVVRFWWDRELPRQCALLDEAETILKQNHVKAVVSWETNFEPMVQPLLQTAQKKGIPCIIYQHGSAFRMDGLTFNHWLFNTNLLLSYGEGTAKQLQDTRPPTTGGPCTRIQAVGSARLDALSRTYSHDSDIQALRAQLKKQDPRPLILYVSTLFGGMGRAFNDLAGYPEVSYFELQQNVFKIFSEFSNVRLLYKDLVTRNSFYNPLCDMLQAQVPNATVIRAHALTKLIWAVDAIIVDHALTGLLETLLTSKPLLVYDPGAIGSIPEPPEARSLLRKRAIVSETPQEFLRDVRTFLQVGNFSERLSPNNECLAQYGTHLNDGRSSERAARAILDFLPSSSPTRPLA